MRNYLLTLFLFGLAPSVFCQDLLTELQSNETDEKDFVLQTFKGTRVVNGFSVETKGKNELEFIIGHRFGRINSGAYNFFGWDEAFIRFGLEYGLTDRLGVGVGRSSYNKIYDGYLKYKAVQQSRGGSPVTLTLVGTMGLQTTDQTLTTTQQLYYSGQALLARKFSPDFSLQLSPSFVHANRVDQNIENNNQFAVGLGGRYKITKSIAINGEYYHRASAPDSSYYKNSMAFAIDIDAGGHVFQLIFSNTQGMVDRTYIGQTVGDFFKGDIHFGFNITRTFQFGNPYK
jgi:hypothetical protein